MTQRTALPRPHREPWTLAESQRWLDRASETMPGKTSSMMKRPEQFCPGRFPAFLTRGHGALVEDADGNEYLDFICGLGANSLGHQHPHILQAIRDTMEQGLLHSLPVPLEQQAAHAVLEALPGAEMLRFFKTGADATSAAVRLARALTSREKILTIGYNGWHDAFMYDTPGVPASVAALSQRLPLFTATDELRCLEALDKQGGELAALVLSLPYNRLVPASLLAELRALTRAHGCLFVLDEIVTGFRLAPGGAQAFYGVDPDLTCVSKALAAGMPLSALVGPRAIMSRLEELQVSTTFGGETLSLAAAVAALEVYKTSNYYEHIAAMGRRLRGGIERIALETDTPLRVLGYDPIPLFLFSPRPEVHGRLMKTFQGHMAARGVLLRRDVNFVCAAHTKEQIDFTLEQARASLLQMRKEGAFADAA